MKKVILFSIPMSICNFRCHYCYLAQREEHYQGVQPQMRFSPEEVAKAMSLKRIGGPCFMNFCADGETLLTKDIDLYVKALVQEGHYAEIVTNLTVNKMIDKILTWDQSLLSHVEFKCSFHYLELKKKGLLDRFADNVKKIWAHGASANIEITPTDELIPYIEEVKAFSMEHFGALPHLSIARDDRSSDISYLTKLSMEEYDKTWSQFGSSFWEFKKKLFGVKRNEFCYAGGWSLFVDLSTGDCRQCYIGMKLDNVFANPEKPFPSLPICKCRTAHCYNGHALLSAGLIPELDTPGYGDLRDRRRADGSHWLQDDLLTFFNTKLANSNKVLGSVGKLLCQLEGRMYDYKQRALRKLSHLK